MRIRWRGLELPTKVELDKDVSTQSYGRIYVEPFERGFGTTVGNSLRRILLSSLEGSAVKSIRIKGADHEFASLPGVIEDVTDIVLNIKSLVVQMESDEPQTMRLEANKIGAVTAAQIEAGPAITIVNKEQVIATLTDNVEFSMEMTVGKGRGYIPTSEDEKAREREHGVIPIDAIYSPVIRVRYKTEDTRVGQLFNYDRLIMEIWTDGTIDPEMAMVESAKILRKHLSPFVNYFELGEELTEEMAQEAEDEIPEVDEEMQRKLEIPITELGLSVRANNCLEMSNINTIGQLAEVEDSRLLEMRNFGKICLREVKRKLADMGIVMVSDER